MTRSEARRLDPLSLNHVRMLRANDRFVLSSRADDDSLCARVAFAGCSGRSHNVQNAYPVGAVGAEQYLCGLAHRFAFLDVDPDIQRGRPYWSSRSLRARRPGNARIAFGALGSDGSQRTTWSRRARWSIALESLGPRRASGSDIAL